MSLFGGRAAELERQNKVLIEVDRIRNERVQKLEFELESLKKSLASQENDLASVRQELDVATKALVSEREFLIGQCNSLQAQVQQLTEWSTAYSLWGQELNNLLRDTRMKEQERKQAAKKLGDKAGPDWAA